MYPSMHWGRHPPAQCMLGYTPLGRHRPGQTPPVRHPSPLGRHPSVRHPRADTPLGRRLAQADTPRADTPLPLG